jgi:hypothetical protein
MALVAAPLAFPTTAAAAGTEAAKDSKAKEDPKKPAAAAKEDPKKAGPADAGAPGDAGGADAAAGAALPPGHPQVGEGLPAGHPPVGQGDEDDEGPAPGQQAPRGFFMGLPDTVEDDPALPVGTLVITIKDAEDRPVPNAPVALGILHSSVAKGDSQERRAANADAAGTVRFDGMPIGAGTSYRASITNDRATFASDVFPLSDKAGKRVVVHVYPASANMADVRVAMVANVFVTLREDALVVEQSFNVFNVGKVAWIPDQAQVGLPAGYKAFNKPEAMSDVRFEEQKGQGARLFGTVGPGQHEAGFRYQVPLEGEEKQTLRIALPQRVIEARVFAEASKSMGLSVAGFPAAQLTQGRDGRRVLITQKQVMTTGERGVDALEITISGLPTPGWGRSIAAWAAGLMALGALAFVFSMRAAGDGAVPDDARKDLLEARDALLDEFVALEKAHRKGDIGPNTYDRLRRALLDALARIEVRLEQTRAARMERRRRGREQQQRPSPKEGDRQEGAS